MRIAFSLPRAEQAFAINVGSHFLRGPLAQPVSKLRLHQCVRGLTAFERVGSRSVFSSKVRSLNYQLGIDPCYGSQHQLALQYEADFLEHCGFDGLKREFWLAPEASQAWRLLKAAALSDTISLVEISGFRSVEYQAALIRGKLKRGQSIAQILQVSAAPGYSEHHTGCAVDIADLKELHSRSFLTEAFELSESYAWLAQNAAKFSFHQSFPRENRHGIAYEPWHWCFNVRR
jgi:zinc D-Ala-D-Ala carboxypeptidase